MGHENFRSSDKATLNRLLDELELLDDSADVEAGDRRRAKRYEFRTPVVVRVPVPNQEEKRFEVFARNISTRADISGRFSGGT